MVGGLRHDSRPFRDKVQTPHTSGTIRVGIIEQDGAQIRTFRCALIKQPEARRTGWSREQELQEIEMVVIGDTRWTSNRKDCADLFWIGGDEPIASHLRDILVIEMDVNIRESHLARWSLQYVPGAERRSCCPHLPKNGPGGTRRAAREIPIPLAPLPPSPRIMV